MRIFRSTSLLCLMVAALVEQSYQQTAKQDWEVPTTTTVPPKIKDPQTKDPLTQQQVLYQLQQKIDSELARLRNDLHDFNITITADPKTRHELELNDLGNQKEDVLQEAASAVDANLAEKFQLLLKMQEVLNKVKQYQFVEVRINLEIRRKIKDLESILSSGAISQGAAALLKGQLQKLMTALEEEDIRGKVEAVKRYANFLESLPLGKPNQSNYPNQPNNPNWPNYPKEPSNPNWPNSYNQPNNPNWPNNQNRPNNPNWPSNQNRPSNPNWPSNQNRPNNPNWPKYQDANNDYSEADLWLLLWW